MKQFSFSLDKQKRPYHSLKFEPEIIMTILFIAMVIQYFLYKPNTVMGKHLYYLTN